MERYYDAHLYVTDWNTNRVMFRLPTELPELGTLADYLVDSQASAWTRGRFTILDFTSADQTGDLEFDCEAVTKLSALTGIRAELAAGDHRPLYLAWLAAFGAWERDEDTFLPEADHTLEPPVPPGLGTLTASQRALADLLRLDADLLAVAAQLSPPRDTASDDLADRVARLPVTEKDRLLTEVLTDDPAGVRTGLLSRFRRMAAGTDGTRRTVADLLDGAARRRVEHGRPLR